MALGVGPEQGKRDNLYLVEEWNAACNIYNGNCGNREMPLSAVNGTTSVNWFG